MKEISEGAVTWAAHRQDHTGINRTIKNIQSEKFWPGMTVDIKPLMNACEAC